MELKFIIDENAETYIHRANLQHNVEKPIDGTDYYI